MQGLMMNCLIVIKVNGDDQVDERRRKTSSNHASTVAFTVRGESRDEFKGFELEVRDGKVMKKVEDVGVIQRGSRSWETFKAIEGVESAPGLDETAESVVRGEMGVFGERLVGEWAGGVVIGEEPAFDALAFVGDAGDGGHWVFHDLEGNWADEVVWNFN